MLPINPIIAAAAANFFLGMALYSDKVFGQSWTKMTGMKCDNLKDMPLRIAFEIIASLMIAAAMYIAIITFKKTELTYSDEMLTKIYSWLFEDVQKVQADIMSSLKISGFMWFGFVFPFLLSKTAWKTTLNWKKFAVESAFTLIQFLSMGCAIAYFA